MGYKLKENPSPYPFCGSEAEIKVAGIKPCDIYMVKCKDPNCGGNTNWWGHKSSAVSAWNRRANDV